MLLQGKLYVESPIYRGMYGKHFLLVMATEHSDWSLLAGESPVLPRL